MQILDLNKKYLITGAAGFVGFFLSKRLLEQGATVIGVDNVNDYYDVRLKEARLEILFQFPNFTFYRKDISVKEDVEEIFQKHRPEIVVNLAAQAGVRYSIDHPDVYMQSNIIGFFNILEACRHYPVEHLLYASSSSVYGANKKIPFSVEDQVDHPVSLYAATKKSNELMAHCYSKLYNIPVTGLRFFTVYGPMGRPDMAYFSFTQKILKGEAISVFNHGDMRRDFTYVDDIVTGIVHMLCNPPALNADGVPYKVYNIGNNQPENLLDFIVCLEKCLSQVYEKELVSEKKFLPMQPGDVPCTYADVTDLMRDFDFKPNTSLETGLMEFAKWYRDFYGA